MKISPLAIALTHELKKRAQKTGSNGVIAFRLDDPTSVQWFPAPFSGTNDIFLKVELGIGEYTRIQNFLNTLKP